MAYIVRGTTPSLIFDFKEVDPATITTAVLAIKQDHYPVIERNLNSATVENDTLFWTLTQEETLRLSCAKPAFISADWLLSDGTRGRSNTLVVDVSEPAKGEILE